MNFNLEEIFAIIDKVTDHNLELFSYEDEDTKLKIKGSSIQKAHVNSEASVLMAHNEDRSEIVCEAEGVKNDINNEVNEKIIVSPMVGTFYAAPAVHAKSFVQVGDHIQEGQVVCIIEAMKLMNEIEAECSGTVEEILVKNEEAVEYGQPLIRVRL